MPVAVVELGKLIRARIKKATGESGCSSQKTVLPAAIRLKLLLA
jgi:hypothetical protein